GPLGTLNLPTEVVSSEFLTMEGRKFSTSRSVVIHVRDFLERYDADALRYFIAVAGPESQDTDFTWAEFVRRNNDELVSTWGNLVNRTVSMIAKNLGSVPAAGPLNDADRAMLDASQQVFGTVGGLIERHRQKQAIGEAMRVATEANVYLSQQAPWKLRHDDPARMATVLHVAAQAVDDLNRVLAPFLPHTAQQIHASLGRTGSVSPGPEIREVDDLDGGRGYPVITGDYSEQAAWASVPIAVGTPVAPPTPVFGKLDPAVIDQELARLQGAAEHDA
ncbi:MAG: class I tRNA ligase family protein, partial [Nocardioidaceae bacterium]|nr:class I tRNA ligase family protein [Nocardioidaceae bacterium]